MLKSRVLTASVLATSFLVLLAFGSWPLFAVVLGIAFSVGAWEWANLSGFSASLSRVAYALVTAGLALIVYWWMGQSGGGAETLKYFLVASCTWWAIALLWVQSYPSSAVLWRSSFVRAIMGWLVLVPAWVALVFLRQAEHGQWAVLLIVVVVASADIGAYFFGRRFGKRKLAADVSPGKSWEGVWGGMFVALIIGSVIVALHSAYSLGPWVLALILPTAIISVVGDLFESMLKRFRGVKDSSHLLPGHGGVLDRIDGLVAAIPVFTLVFLASNGKL